jgi:hypothetical protein
MTYGAEATHGHPMTSTRPRGTRLVPMVCRANLHVKDVCAHPGSKSDLVLAKSRRRAKNKVARKSRRLNRSR